jgi:hypothetical protein
MTATLSPLGKQVFAIANAGANKMRRGFAQDALEDASAELHAALIQVSPSDDAIMVEHMRAAKKQIDRALAYLRDAQ